MLSLFYLLLFLNTTMKLKKKAWKGVGGEGKGGGEDLSPVVPLGDRLKGGKRFPAGLIDLPSLNSAFQDKGGEERMHGNR